MARFTQSLEALAQRAPDQLRPAADRVAASPRLAAAGLGFAVVGAGLILATNKHTRAGVAALVGAAIGVSAAARKNRGGYGF
ncbi:hypothetical protein ABOZ73_07250 [Caulobacter sp. 73W]|uniref:DUF3618 domain-containing protein n=1 Tax=Caulobacter sp. 73W TaxID=3161137 RepID=A0AB39KWM4_9CAUL